MKETGAKFQDEIKELKREIKYLQEQQEKTENNKRGSEESLEVIVLLWEAEREMRNNNATC